MYYQILASGTWSGLMTDILLNWVTICAIILSTAFFDIFIAALRTLECFTSVGCPLFTPLTGSEWSTTEFSADRFSLNYGGGRVQVQSVSKKHFTPGISIITPAINILKGWNIWKVGSVSLSGEQKHFCAISGNQDISKSIWGIWNNEQYNILKSDTAVISV